LIKFILLLIKSFYHYVNDLHCAPKFMRRGKGGGDGRGRKIIKKLTI
jgi:hypothetical protein